MKLNTQGREYFGLDLTTSPATQPTDWEASFDEGATWHTAIDLFRDGVHWSAWLVQGVNAPTPYPVPAPSTLTHSVTPRVRLINNPEVIVRDMDDFKIYIDA